jgi:hypothetical protein
MLQIYEELPSVKKGRRDQDYDALQGEEEHASAPPVQGLPTHNVGRGEPVVGYPAIR